MFKLFRTDDGQYKVISETAGLDCSGTLEEMKQVMRSLRTPAEQIEIALDHMLLHSANCADFGMNLDTHLPSFIYADNRVLEYKATRQPVLTWVDAQKKTA